MNLQAFYTKYFIQSEERLCKDAELNNFLLKEHQSDNRNQINFKKTTTFFQNLCKTFRRKTVRWRHKILQIATILSELFTGETVSMNMCSTFFVILPSVLLSIPQLNIIFLYAFHFPAPEIEK